MTVAADRQCHAQAFFSPATGRPAPSKHHLLLRGVARQRCRRQPVQATAGFEQSRRTALLVGGVLLRRSQFRAASIASKARRAEPSFVQGADRQATRSRKALSSGAQGPPC